MLSTLLRVALPEIDLGNADYNCNGAEQVGIFALIDMARSFRGSLRLGMPSLERKDAPAVRSRVMRTGPVFALAEHLAKGRKRRCD